VRRSKTDQEAQGEAIAVLHGTVTCPIEAMCAWLHAAGIGNGAVFRHVKKGGRLGERLTDKRVGLNPVLFAGHSLRAGFVTSAAANGASPLRIMDVSRHKSINTLQAYIRGGLSLLPFSR
jgi:hypothetical protein